MPQALKNLFAGHAAGGNEQKVGGGIRPGKTALPQLGHCVGAGGADLAHRITEVILILHGGHGGSLGEGIDVVWAIAELDAVHIGNQLRVCHAEAHAGTGQIVGFGEGLHHNHIVIFLGQRNAAGVWPGKINVRLVHNHNAVGVGAHHFLNGGHRLQQGGGGVGVGNHDGLIQAVVLAQIQREIFLHQDHMLRNVQQIAQNRVKAVGDIGKCQRVGFITESAQRQQQVFIAAVAAQNIFRLHAAVAGNGGAERGFGQIGIQPQPRHCSGHRRRHAGGRRVGVFVGVQLDKVRQFQLLAGGIRLQRSQRFGKITAHLGHLFVGAAAGLPHRIRKVRDIKCILRPFGGVGVDVVPDGVVIVRGADDVVVISALPECMPGSFVGQPFQSGDKHRDDLACAGGCRGRRPRRPGWALLNGNQ